MSLLLELGVKGAASPALASPCLLLLRQLSSLGASASHASGADSSSVPSTPDSPPTPAQALYRQLRQRGVVVAPSFIDSRARLAHPIAPHTDKALKAQASHLPTRNYLQNAAVLQVPHGSRLPRSVERPVLGDKHRIVLQHIVDALDQRSGDGEQQAALGLERKAVWQAMSSHFRSKVEFRDVLRELCTAGLVQTYPPVNKKASASFLYGPSKQLGPLWKHASQIAAARRGRPPAAEVAAADAQAQEAPVAGSTS